MPNREVEQIVGITGRAPGTDAERRAADLLRRKLIDRGRSAELQAIYVHRSPETVQALHAILGVAASVISVYLPPLGFGLLLTVIASCYLDLCSRAYLLRRLLFRRGSQNVISQGGKPEAPERIILAAGCDVPRTGWMKGSRARDLRERLPARLRPVWGVYRFLLWGGLAPLIPLMGARLTGYDPTWLTAVQIFPTVLLIILSFLLIDSSLATPSPGASENASGLVAALELTGRLDAEPPAHCDVWVVLTGGSTCFGEGMKAFLADQPPAESERRTTVIELQAVGSGTHCYRSSQGAGIGVEPPDRLVAAIAGTPAVSEPVSGDAVAAASAGVDAITLTAVSNGLPQRWRSTLADLPETVEESTIDEAVATAERAIRTIDAAAAAGASGATEMEESR